MFGVDSTELIIVALFALIFIGPKELPTAMRTVGRFVGRVRAHARHFTSGIENMMREAELEEMEKRWREENARIMALHPATPGEADAMPPVVDPYALSVSAGSDGQMTAAQHPVAAVDDTPAEAQDMLPLGLPPAPDATHGHLPPTERPLP